MSGACDEAIARAWRADHEARILEGLCAFGGRLAGTPEEERARAWLADYVKRESGLAMEAVPFEFQGWRGEGASIVAGGVEVPAGLLVGTPGTQDGGVTAPVLDAGRGTPDDFDLLGDRVRGAIVLVRHEYMFTRTTVHRRVKYAEAIRRGAVGFVIGAHIPGIAMIGGAVSGAEEEVIPGLAVGYEGAARLAATAACGGNVTLVADAERGGMTRAHNLVLDLPGQGDRLVALTAHIDGHLPAVSALDNASGVAAAVAAALALAPQAGRMSAGVRLCIFTAEEWALTGSRVYLDEMAPAERADLSCNVNLDSVAGAPDLTALTSGFETFGASLNAALEGTGLSLGEYPRLMANSDHANFAAHGIPAARIVAGFDRPESNLKYVLTSADTPDKVAPAELKTATLMAVQLVAALAADA